MATWSPTTPIAVDMPGTAEWANMVQDNPVAIAEGASGAPKNMGISLGGVWLGSGMGNSAATGSYTGLGRVKVVRYSIAFAAASTLQVRFTNTNGATWGAWQNTSLSVPNPAGTIVDVTVDLVTGAFRCSGLSMAASSNTPLHGADSLTPLANANGVHVGLTGGQVLSQQAYIIGGRP